MSTSNLRVRLLAGGVAAVALLAAADARAGPTTRVSSPLQTASLRQQAAPVSDTPGQRAFAEGLRLLDAGDHDGARRRFEEALRAAADTGNDFLAAGCHRGLGLAAAAQGRHEDAQRAHRAARQLFAAVGNQAYTAASDQSLGTALYWLGRRDEAREAWQAAAATFEALGDHGQQASVLYNLAFLASGADDKRDLLDRAMPLARQAGNRPLEGQLLAARADLAFTGGDYRSAFDDIQQGIIVLTEAGRGAQKGLAHAYTSLGRLYRAHAQFELAIAAYQRAMAFSEATHDLVAQAQSARAIAIAYEGLGQQDRRRQFLERSLALIRGAGVPSEEYFAEVHLAAYMLDTGDLAGALRILDRVAATDWGRGSEWAQNTWARARVAAGNAAQAMEPADRAVALARRADDVERLFHGLQIRASAHLALAQYPEAFADLSEALDLVERLRQRLVPHDYMKRGFMDRFRVALGMTMETLDRLGRPAEALEVAERGRARAFADLLIARRVQRNPEPLPAALAVVDSDVPRGDPPAAGDASRATRGGRAARPPEAADDLPSDSLAPPATVADLRSGAAALDVVVVSYWVDRRVTWAWVVSPAGDLGSARIAIAEDRLGDLVRGIWRAHPGRADTPAARELHRLLIDPLRRALADAGTHRLVVIPHGPLSALSFAALQDADGRYLVEDYAVSYVPSGWLLTRRDAQPEDTLVAATYLLVGAPVTLTDNGAGGRLTPLPGARRELARVAARVTAARAIGLTGHQASEARFRTAARHADVVHVATHGVMLDDAPLDSFLALDAGGRRGPASDDGRLTAREVYDIDLRARLVVLSACRSGLGRPSGDGLFGLARAFFYAGARTVVATLWDVADEPSARLMPRFHELVAGGASASDALRTAQLALLRDLRAGRVVVQGRRGPVPLPEHPSLWAGFVLLGHP
jgi:CHAT domain-containing protein/tetratricopeptide (TPR) repeat protein